MYKTPQSVIAGLKQMRTAAVSCIELMPNTRERLQCVTLDVSQQSTVATLDDVLAIPCGHT